MRLLDLFAGAGGAAVGYHRAGFTDILGIDVAPQPRYPFAFQQADALEFLAGVRPGEYDLVHASPPCQGYSRMRHLPWLRGRTWPKLIGPVREALQRLGTPWVIENVADAPLDGLILCGTMFGLKVYRHRRFESSELLLSPEHPRHTEVIGKGRLLNDRAGVRPRGFVSLPSKVTRLAKMYHADGMVSVGGHNFRTGPAQAAMGIDWMSRAELAQAIPPAFTCWVGRQLLRSLAAAP